MNEIERLQYISLCSKLSSEIFNQIGIKDKVLTEYVIDRAIEARDEDDFIEMMNQDGSEFGLQFCVSIYNSVYKMLPSSYIRKKKEPEARPAPIKTGGPQNTKSGNGLFGPNEDYIPNNLPKDELAKRFPGLSLANNNDEIDLDLEDIEPKGATRASREDGCRTRARDAPERGPQARAEPHETKRLAQLEQR
jgi:hypothetical protein